MTAENESLKRERERLFIECDELNKDNFCLEKRYSRLARVHHKRKQESKRLRAHLKAAEEKNEAWAKDWDNLLEDHSCRCEHIDQLQREIYALVALIRDTDMGDTACCDCKAQHVCDDPENCADVRIKWALSNVRKTKS